MIETAGLLTPYEINLQKQRFGPNADGGYVLAGNLDPSQTILSYGISTEYQFDAEMAALGHQVHMFDHTIQGIERTSLNQHFHREGTAGVTNEGANLYTIEDHLEKYDIKGGNMILKMDVEGAEYESLLAVSDETLLRFDQIVLELHHLKLLGQPRARRRFTRLLKKLNRAFTIFHVHANNHAGYNGLTIIEGVVVPNLLELSFVRTSLVTRGPSSTLYPTRLDYPNCSSKPELPLLFYPFIPTALKRGRFGAFSRRLKAQEIDSQPERPGSKETERPQQRPGKLSGE